MPSQFKALAARISPTLLEDAAGVAALAVILFGALSLASPL